MKNRTNAASKGSNADNGGTRIDIEAILRTRMNDFSPSEKNLAGYLLDNVQMLPFETGGSIAHAVGVSEMTVTRFVRGLGFDNLRDLKNRLRNSVAEKDSEIDDYMARFQVRDSRQQALQESLRLELNAIVKAYALSATDIWDVATEALAKTRTIYVVGFQASKGLAMDFASRLLWARPNVIFVENSSGTFGEIIAADPKHSLVVLIDTAAYATRGVKLAEKLKSLDMPLVIVTDKFSHWAFSYTHFVFEAHTHVKTFWDSTASLSVILNLMIDTVAIRLGPMAKKNFATMNEMGSLLGEFVGGSYARGKD
ncbi:MurR/RpiR family transcriptional regulator [Phyllobacterium calauticae]|jgi:DNA-binding MurR/RpiR family transcriptional regulator|uniref:MurR/RpiR family transcriptional regulator n=1 Tax=Phyllobacterium calauticae TaxID=2817027 RepID=UPI001CBD6C36|nr:MurR/RpiR family transcriptional regulator [Phyllobacterium calauticae]MBZ3695230.1 MurR/RpiR family transcriptional regulator [Phyllobacterium calauticae]